MIGRLGRGLLTHGNIATSALMRLDALRVAVDQKNFAQGVNLEVDKIFSAYIGNKARSIFTSMHGDELTLATREMTKRRGNTGCKPPRT